MQTMDAEKHAIFIIEHVLEYGSWNDILTLVRYYGTPQIKEAAVKAKFFLPDTVNFLSLVFNLNKEETACYISRPYQKSAAT